MVGGIEKTIFFFSRDGLMVIDQAVPLVRSIY